MTRLIISQKRRFLSRYLINGKLLDRELNYQNRSRIMREYEIDRASNFAKLQFYRVGLVTRFMTMKGRKRKGLSK